ncbi:MAG: transposase [Candidatus Omnitrophota bacterium]
MARPYRLQGEGILYHITSRGDDRKKIFLSEFDFERFLEYLIRAKEKFKFYLYAYCLMDNHYHLLLETTQPNLSRIMQNINSSYTLYYNKKRGKCGHVFQGRYKSIIVEADEYFKELSRYIHLNPVKARIVNNPGEYKWSSYRAYLNKAKDSEIVDIAQAKRLLGMEMKQYSSFVNAGIGAKRNVMEKVYAGFLLGGKEFIKEQLAEIANQASEKDFAYKREVFLQTEPTDIINLVAKHFKQEPEEIKISKKRPMTAKKMAIYLMRRKTNLTNNQIGKIFNMKFSAVSKAVVDFTRQIDSDKRLKMVVEMVTSKVEV